MRPILFNTSMVQAILDGRKTQTIRPVAHPLAKCLSGDTLYVREAFRFLQPFGYEYKADNPLSGTFRPSIHMPRAAARIFLRVVSTAKKAVVDLTHQDAVADSFGSVAELKSVICDIYGPLEEVLVCKFTRIIT